MALGFLILETGESYCGEWLGGDNRAGEVVFNTSHSGYEEIATDPSYFNQIVVMTSPMMGNYGMDKSVWESQRYWIQGFVALEIYSGLEKSWSKRLEEFHIPSLQGIDTRALVLRLREGGTPWGALIKAETIEMAKNLALELIQKAKKQDSDWVFATSTPKTYNLTGSLPSGPRIGVIDFGTKKNILRECLSRSKEVVVFNSRVSPEEILAFSLNGIVLTNGPGNPEDVKVAPNTVSKLIGKIPIFGICMGHQILGLAAGAKTYKLKYGHRGSNHPIEDQLLNRIYMTAQNHGYAIDQEMLKKDFVVTHRNLNDQSVAGMFSKSLRALSVQFHPESRPGPHESSLLFDYFFSLVSDVKYSSATKQPQQNWAGK
jgi:carbamoyl-phosphate synthase small subunit